MDKKKDIDGGFAWVVVTASFFAHIFQYGVVWTVGVFYAVFVEVFVGSKGAIALISSLNTAVYYMTGPLASFLTNHYGPRLVALAGSIIGSAGLICSMFATNIFHLYITFGFITGFGFGIAYIPSIAIVGHYFEKKRTIALGLAVSGCGIGTFLFPPMLRFFINHYGWRSALLLTGGVCLNMCVAAAFMRPIKLQPLTKPDKYHNASIDNIKKKEQQLSKWETFLKLLNLHIFNNRSYIMLCLNNFFFTFGLSIIYVHLASYATTLGFTDDQGAMLFSALGIANFLGRISFGLFAHLPCFSPISLYCVAFFITGAVTEFCPLLHSYMALMAYAVIFGFLSASLGTLLPAVIVDILDVRLLSSGYGYVLVFEALGTLLGAPVAGWVYDTTGIYKTSFYLGGASIMTSSFLMTYPWFCDAKKDLTYEAVETKVVGKVDVESAKVDEKSPQSEQLPLKIDPMGCDCDEEKCV